MYYQLECDQDVGPQIKTIFTSKKHTLAIIQLSKHFLIVLMNNLVTKANDPYLQQRRKTRARANILFTRLAYSNLGYCQDKDLKEEKRRRK
jgi:hypothetical protein